MAPYDKLPPRFSPDNSPEARRERMRIALAPPLPVEPDQRPRYILGPLNNVIGIEPPEPPPNIAA